MPYEVNQRNFLSDLINASGVAAEQASMVLQSRIEDDKVKQADRAFNGLMPSDDASTSGKRANMLIATQDAAAEASMRMQEMAKTFTGTDAEWSEQVAANRRNVQQSIYERYPDLSKDPETMKAITNVFMEQQPAISGARIASKLSMEHNDRYRNFSSMVSNQLLDKQGDDYVKSTNDLRAIGKSLQLTDSEVDTAFASMALGKAREGNSYYIEMLKDQKDKYGASLYDKLPELQKGLKDAKQISFLRDRELIASHRMDIQEQYISGKMSKSDVLTDMKNMNLQYNNLYMSTEQEISFFAYLESSKAKQKKLNNLFDPNSKVSANLIADLSPKEQQEGLQRSLSRIDDSYDSLVKNGTLSQDEAYKRARAEKVSIREKAASRGIYDENISKRISGISKFSVEALTDNKQAIDEIKEVAADFLNVPSGSRGAVFKEQDYIFMTNLLANRESKLNWGQSLELAQKQRDGAPIRGEALTNAMKSAKSIAGDISSRTISPFDNMPDGSKNAILNEIQGKYISYLSAGLSEDAATELVTNRMNNLYHTVDSGGILSDNYLLRGNLDMLSSNNYIAKDDIGRYIDGFVKIHQDEIEDRLGHSIDSNDIMLDYDENNNTVSFKETKSGIGVGIAINADDLFTDSAWEHNAKDRYTLYNGLTSLANYDSLKAYKASVPQDKLPSELDNDVNDEISVKAANITPKANPLTLAAYGKPILHMDAPSIKQIQSSLGLKDSGVWSPKDQVVWDLKYASNGGIILDSDVKDIFIKHESGAKGYDSVYLGGSRELKSELGGSKPTNLSINEILRLQENAIANGAKSTAIGQYQIVSSTLKEAVNKLGLSGDEKFTPDIQDAIAKNYLLYSKRSKIKEYLDTGDPKKLKGAQKALSMEFSSFANPDTGKSYYHGDGLNKASMDVEDSATFLKLLYTRHYQNQ